MQIYQYYTMALNFVFKNIHTDPWQAILTEESFESISLSSFFLLMK